MLKRFQSQNLPCRVVNPDQRVITIVRSVHAKLVLHTAIKDHLWKLIKEMLYNKEKFIFSREYT
jgi:hypothetical protein